ncbi:hypothetical protein PIB30_037787 [Stylosanthes scabra]|uniref:Uncharacterized protein n=1 Tax=Stylosanthes scabra TaxID=79078 RepID=A0ABU6XE65_9FABA|nr:hypothetical protein [Stylosanthes scabra]
MGGSPHRLHESPHHREIVGRLTAPRSSTKDRSSPSALPYSNTGKRFGFLAPTNVALTPLSIPLLQQVLQYHRLTALAAAVLQCIGQIIYIPLKRGFPSSDEAGGVDISSDDFRQSPTFSLFSTKVGILFASLSLLIPLFVPPCIKEDVEKLLDISRTMGQLKLNVDLVALVVGLVDVLVLFWLHLIWFNEIAYEDQKLQFEVLWWLLLLYFLLDLSYHLS